MLHSLESFVKKLDHEGELQHVHVEVDPTLEIAEIHRRVVANRGKALFFHRVKNSPFPVVTNLFGSERRLEIAFGNEPEAFVKSLVELIQGPFPPQLGTLWQKRNELKRIFSFGLKRGRYAPVTECEID